MRILILASTSSTCEHFFVTRMLPLHIGKVITLWPQTLIGVSHSIAIGLFLWLTMSNNRPGSIKPLFEMCIYYTRMRVRTSDLHWLKTVSSQKQITCFWMAARADTFAGHAMVRPYKRARSGTLRPRQKRSQCHRPQHAQTSRARNAVVS